MDDLSLNKVRISVLWIMEAVTYLAYLAFMMTAPGILDKLKSGTIEGTPVDAAVMVFATLFAIVLLMAFLSLTLRGPLNRWVNVGAGAVFAVLEALALTTVLANPYGSVVFMSVLKVIIAASIAWLAFTTLRVPERVPEPVPGPAGFKGPKPV